jgi:hypothetical protein
MGWSRTANAGLAMKYQRRRLVRDQVTNDGLKLETGTRKADEALPAPRLFVDC